MQCVPGSGSQFGDDVNRNKTYLKDYCGHQIWYSHTNVRQPYRVVILEIGLSHDEWLCVYMCNVVNLVTD